jgi:CheY-like chemotaxis protein
MANILVIDDIAGVRRTIVGILSRHGHAVDEANSGIAGTTMASARRYDVVITDILMPEQDGIETIDQLRLCSPGTKVIAVSGGGAMVPTSDALRLAKTTADGVLRKPFDASELIATVNKVLAGEKVYALD